jgi:predicted CoA-binding protein
MAANGIRPLRSGQRLMQNPPDSVLRDLLRSVNRIAVVGIKSDPAEDAYRVPAYLQAHGYRIQPVSPKLRSVLGEPCVPAIGELADAPELVNLFRAPAHVAAHADEILALPNPPRAVWLQLGIRDDASAERLARAGIAVVQDLCIMVEHRRLVLAGARA